MSITSALKWVSQREPDDADVVEELFGLTGAGDAFKRVNNILWSNVWLNLLFVSVLIADFVQPDTSCVARILDGVVGVWAFIAAVKSSRAAYYMDEVKKATLAILDSDRIDKETNDSYGVRN